MRLSGVCITLAELHGSKLRWTACERFVVCADEMKPVPLKEQDGNSQGAKYLDMKEDLKADINRAKSMVKAAGVHSKPSKHAAHRPASAMAANTPATKPSKLSAPTTVAAGLNTGKSSGVGKTPAAGAAGAPLPMVTPKLPGEGVRRPLHEGDELDEVEDYRSSLLSKEDLKRTLERRKKRKEQRALEAARR